MRRVVFILLSCAYTLGSLCTPLGDFSYMPNLPKMYEQCKAEDPDINALDFVCEHLLNLEDVMAQFEGEEEDKHESPHQPFQLVHAASQITLAVSKPMIFEPIQMVFIADKCIKYPLLDDRFTPDNYPFEIFHPPAV